MENKIKEETNLFQKISSIVKEKRKFLIYILILVVLIIFALVFYKIYDEKVNTMTSEKYVKAGIYLTSNDKEKSKKIYKDIILSKNKLYSILALNSILENELESNTDEVLKLFNIIENIKISKEQKNLVKLKKAFYLIKNSKEDEGQKILKEIISSNSAWKKIAIEAIK